MANTRRLLPLLLVGAGALLIAAAALALLVQPAEAPAVIVTSAPPAQGPYPEVPRVPVAEAQAAVEAGEAVVVDVRSAEAYAAGRVPGALSLPLDELADRAAAELDPNTWIITYCT
jgi:3-mercaptopyruvate sulfurtransferase SseA